MIVGMRRIARLGAVLAAIVWCAGCAGFRPTPAPSAASASTAPGADVGTALDAQVPAAILDLPLQSSNGKVVRLSDFAGKVVAISDVMTLCQETCPMDTATFVDTARAEAAADHSDEVFLSITVDPKRDTTAQLAAYRTLFSPPTSWLTLTGSQASVDKLWDYLGVWRQRTADPAGQRPRNWRTGKPLTYDIQHSDEVFFLDRRQHERFVLEGPPYTQSGSVPATLRKFLNDQGRANLAHPQSTAWTEAQARQVLAWLR
jgi:protein SCO1